MLPSRTDTFGVVLLEAMASGTPVAAFPVTGPKDVVVPGVTGYLSENLRSAALQALNLKRENCRTHATGFTWARAADLLLDNLARIPAGKIENAFYALPRLT